MDAAVLQQLLQRHPGDLAADAVEARQHDRVGRVVDDEVDAGEVLQRADVAALAADDAALHVVGGELDDGDGRLGRVTGGDPLHHDGEDVADAAVGVALGLLLDPAHELGRLVADLVLEVLQQQLLGLRGGDAGEPLELVLVVAAAGGDGGRLGLQRRRAILEPALAPREVGALLVERLLLAEDPLLDADDLGAALAQRGVHVGGDSRVRLRHMAAAAFRVERGSDHQAHCQHRCRDHDFHCRSSPQLAPRGSGCSSQSVWVAADGPCEGTDLTTRCGVCAPPFRCRLGRRSWRASLSRQACAHLLSGSHG